MDENRTPDGELHETAGQQFVRRIRPAGCALFLIVFVLTTVLCFTIRRDPVKGYKAPQTTEYYAAHTDELAAELEANVFPSLSAYTLSAEAGENTVTVTVHAGDLKAAKGDILMYFDESLLEFRQE